MALKVVNVCSCATAVLVTLLLCGTVQAQNAPQQQPSSNAFDAQTASRLLLQLSEALQGHSQKQFLGLFDLDKMKNGPLFKQQINSFFGQTESIRVHLNLTDTSLNEDKANLAVAAEMEAAPSSGGAPERRNERLTFTVERVGDKWKFVEVQPRSFFSLQ
jgi:hypothetical protein